MIDSYINGKIERISPEAPVPVVHISSREERLGGAANVALNIKALKATPVLCSVIGKDKMGDRFMELLKEEAISSDGIVRSYHRPTTVKHRVMAGNHHVIRLDDETDQDIAKEIEREILQKLNELIPSCNVVIIEDYDKGVLNKTVISHIIKVAHTYRIPVTVDPKIRNFKHYKNVDLFKPNFKELQGGINKKIDIEDFEEVKWGVDSLFRKIESKYILLTLSEKGVYMTNGSEKLHVPAHYRDISDVSGAGDTVISVASVALAKGMGMTEIVELANLSGGLVCEYHGVVPIKLDRLIKEYNVTHA